MTMMVKVCAANIAIELAIKLSGSKFIGYKGPDRQDEISPMNSETLVAFLNYNCASGLCTRVDWGMPCRS